MRTAPYYVPEVAWSAELTGVFRADISLCDGPDVAAGTFGDNTYDSLPKVLSAEVGRGRSQPWTGIEQGTCRMIVSDPTGIYDPTNTASPLYGLLDDMRPVRLRMVWGGTPAPSTPVVTDPEPTSGYSLLMETGDFLLTETGDTLGLEG